MEKRNGLSARVRGLFRGEKSDWIEKTGSMAFNLIFFRIKVKGKIFLDFPAK
jgi:hypothetical protein